MSERISYIEMDISRCSLDYGVSPCAASIGVTGESKCYNTLKSCQDTDNYSDVSEIARYSVATAFLPTSIDAIPCISNIAYTPSIISLGESIGTRSTLTITFTDLLTPDTGPAGDPYIISRDYNPYAQGTYWGKFKARQPYLRGRVLRWYNGKVGDTLETMEVRTFLIDSVAGPDANGKFTVVAKDPLKLLDDKQAQAPALSKGSLSADLAIGATSLTLTPSGIGDEEYPSSGYASIAGNEIVSYTRSGDVMSIGRAALNTEAQDHDTDDRVQVVLQYSALAPNLIINDLLTTYSEIPSAYINLPNWAAETSQYLGRVYSGFIAEPTGVVTLINELLQQSAISLWWDEIGQQIRLQVLRDIPKNSQEINDDIMMSGSFSQKDQPSKRVSQVWTYFGQINPLESQSDPTNYRATLSTVSLSSETNHGSPSIKTFYSRWIPQFGRTTAERLNNLLLGRYSEPPKLFTFKLLRDSGSIMPLLGSGYSLRSFMNQGFDGSSLVSPCQALSIATTDSAFTVSAEEVLISGDVDPIVPTTKRVTIDADTNNFNFRNAFLSIYSEAVSGDTVICEVSEGVVIGSINTAAFAFDTGSGWPAGITLQMVIGSGAYIVGAGGDGGVSAINVGASPTVQPSWFTASAGGNGGSAMRASIPIEIDNGGIIGGGGGGGGGGFGGFLGYTSLGGSGGAGRVAGSGGVASFSNASNAVSVNAANGKPGTLTTGGDYAITDYFTQGARGGNLGGHGDQSTPLVTSGFYPVAGSLGGAPGNAVNGDSFVTWTTLGDIRGARV